jgi:hypothetical protein
MNPPGGSEAPLLMTLSHWRNAYSISPLPSILFPQDGGTSVIGKLSILHQGQEVSSWSYREVLLMGDVRGWATAW